MRSEAAWSHLSPLPVNIYDPAYDAHITYWNGVGMSQNMALLIMGVTFLNLYPAYSQREAAFKEHLRIYRSGGFKTSSWGYILNEARSADFYNRLIGYICMNDKQFFVKLKEKYTAAEAMSWFLPSKEIQVNRND